MPEEKSTWGNELWSIVRIIIISLAIVLPIRYFIAQPFIVRGSSMEPNFADREYLVIDEVSFFFREPRRGEAIVFRLPQGPHQFLIKRVIGLPGETVLIKSGRVTVVNAREPAGRALEESYLDPSRAPTYPDMEVTLGPEDYFVMGDNRLASSDSRVWGWLPRNFIVGRAVFRAWPVARFGLVPDFSVK